MMVRSEQSRDDDAVRGVVARAFEGTPTSAPPVDDDGVPGEATLVEWLRESVSYDKRFALVAVDGEDVVGHVISTWGDLGGVPTLGLGPISVEPSRQGQGIGARLMEASLTAAREAGERVVVLLGDPAYYARFGFVPASSLGITADPTWGDYFQACPLTVRSADDDECGSDRAAEYSGPRGVFTYAEPFAWLG